MAQGLIGQTSAQVAYAATSAALQERGIRVSAKEVDRAARDVASWRREEESAVVSALFDRGAQAQTEEGPTPRGVVSSVFDWSRWKRGGAVMICVDGAKVRSPHQGKDGLEWFEPRVGVIAPITPVANKAPVHQTGSHNKAYLGGVVSADALFDRLKAVWEQGPHQDCSVVFVADGATRMALRGYGTVCVCTSRAVLRCWTFITRGSTSPAQRLPCYLVG